MLDGNTARIGFAIMALILLGFGGVFILTHPDFVGTCWKYINGSLSGTNWSM